LAISGSVEVVALGAAVVVAVLDGAFDVDPADVAAGDDAPGLPAAPLLVQAPSVPSARRAAAHGR